MALASAFMLVPMAVGIWALIIYLIPAIIFSSSSVDGVSPTGAFVDQSKVGSDAERLPDSLDLYFIEEGVVLQRPVARSRGDADFYVPCGNSVVTSLDGLSLYRLPDSVASNMDVGWAARQDRPAGCDDALVD